MLCELARVPKHYTVANKTLIQAVYSNTTVPACLMCWLTWGKLAGLHDEVIAHLPEESDHLG